ncbi:MAG: hypothetical protein JNN08_18430 [Bryobacterales bacterium]|nr:hypothetical protein [Bryobacterales bacterium]
MMKIFTFATCPSDEPAASRIRAIFSSDPPQFRLRVGDYRIRFRRVSEEIMHAVRVLDRREAYRVLGAWVMHALPVPLAPRKLHVQQRLIEPYVNVVASNQESAPWRQA